MLMFCEPWRNSSHSLCSLISADDYCVLRRDRHRKQGGVVLIMVRNIFNSVGIFSDSVRDAYEIGS